MATVYFDLPNVTNGTGTSASPKNATGWAAQVKTAGDTYLFKRGTTSASTAFALTSGTAGNVITWGSWFNADGSDDTTVARPVLVSSSVLSTLAAPANFVTVQNLEFSAVAMTVADDKAFFFLGTSSTAHNNIIDTNIGVFAAWDKSNVTITSNSVFGVSHSSANNNNVCIVSGTTTMDTITINQNTFRHYGGGGTTSHNVRIETTHATGITNLTVYGNSITTSTGIANVNKAALGLRLQRTPSADIRANTIRFHLSGIFSIGGGTATAVTFRFNTLQYNSHFGLHLTTDMVGCTIDTNNCSFNGTSTNDGVNLFAYGRGIEMSSAAGQAKCSGHTIRFNTCNNNFNYGGPNDNASEGVGIGFDDGTNGCTCYGNTLQDNEGNGIQYYGGVIGSGSPAISDTGGNHVVANFFKNNCTNAVKNRRTGGTTLTLFVGHINMATVLGTTPTYVAHNVFVGTTPVAVAQDGSCSLVLVTNNVFMSTAHALMFGNVISVGSVNSNDFFGVTQKFCLNGTQADGSPTYAVKTYTGTNDLTFDPSITSTTSPAYFPPTTSALIGAGFSYAANQHDFIGTTYTGSPTIGMYQFISGTLGTPTVGGQIRKLLSKRR